MPGVSVPKDGYLVPSDAPGFGMDIAEDWITPWDHGRLSTGGEHVIL
jgi:hypothetical protein